MGGYQIIKAETRLATMVQWFSGVQRRVTDFIVGGKTRTKFESVAVEMEAQDYQIYRAIKKAIPVSIYQAFNFQLLPPSAASGLLLFATASANAQDVQIALGTKVATVGTQSTPETVYATTAAAVLTAGQTSVSVPIACIAPGTIGNTGPSTIVVLKTTIPGITSVSNALGLINGANLEQEAARKTRFNDFISTLSRGTEAAVIYGAKTAYLTDSNGNITEAITDARIAGPPDSGSAGAFTCYIYNGATGASSSLVTLAQQILDGYTDGNGNKVAGYKAAGIVATVAAVTTHAQDVSASVSIATGASWAQIQAQINTAISTYLQSMRIGTTFIFNDLVALIMNVSGVADVTISAPTANHTATSSQVIILGALTVTQA